MSTMKLPANYATINEEEMVYLDGGASFYDNFLNVGKVFNSIARIFSGASCSRNGTAPFFAAVQPQAPARCRPRRKSNILFIFRAHLPDLFCT